MLQLQYFIFGTLVPTEDEVIVALDPPDLCGTFLEIAKWLDPLALVVADAMPSETVRLIHRSKQGTILYVRFFGVKEVRDQERRDGRGRAVRRYQVVLLDAQGAEFLEWDPLRLDPFLHTGIVGGRLMLPTGPEERLQPGQRQVPCPISVESLPPLAIPHDEAFLEQVERSTLWLGSGEALAIREADLGVGAEWIVRRTMARLLGEAALAKHGTPAVPAAILAVPTPVGYWATGLDAQFAIRLCSLRPGHEILPKRWTEFQQLPLLGESPHAAPPTSASSHSDWTRTSDGQTMERFVPPDPPRDLQVAVADQSYNPPSVHPLAKSRWLPRY